MMMRGIMRIAPCFILALFLIAGCAAMSDKESVPPRHPEELDQGRANCLECHDDETSGALKPYSSFVHTAVFLREHGFYTSQGQNLCASCHGPGFCQTCHAVEDELLPSIKFGDRPDLDLPHRGDYIIQHQIDGRVDPGSCVTCHGNRNNEVCSRCHR